MIKGERVTLRMMTKDDIPRQHEFNQDRELYVLDGSTVLPATPLQQAEAFYESRNRMNPDEFVPLAIEADGKYIGGLELAHIDRREGICELGIQIGDSAYWGRGFGREAIGLVLDYAFRELNLRRVSLTVTSENERAIRCYRACGFVEEGRQRKAKWLSGRYIDWVNMGILREEWSAPRSSQATEPT